MELNDLTVKWKWLKSQVALVRDDDLRRVMMAELRKRAYNEWGFDPENTKINTTQKIELADWEKEFVEDIRKASIYEIDTRKEKREKERAEAKARMKDFVEKGGSWLDFPEDLRNQYTAELYLETVLEKIIECERFLFTN